LRIAVLYSGGKDSTYAALVAKKTEELVCLITLVPMRDDSWMFHFPNIGWTKLQAEALELPQITMGTEGLKEKELDDLKNALDMAKKSYSIEGVYTGALASEYQKSRVERVCSELRLKTVSPLWHTNPETHLRRLLEEKFDVIMIGVAAMGLDQRWLGRHLDEDMVKELLELHRRYGVHIGLEGGEGETFVLDCPIFRERIEVTSAEKVWRGDSGYLVIKQARLIPK
jgi:diphthine-ammonia ligase